MENLKPDLSHLRVWGCRCFVLYPPEIHNKGSSRCFEAIFVAYDENRLGYCVCDLNGKYFFFRDVLFDESTPGCLHSFNAWHASPSPPPSEPASPPQSPVLQPARSSSTPPSSSPNPDPIPVPPASPQLPALRPRRNMILTEKGLAYLKDITSWNDRLICLCATRTERQILPEQSLSTIINFQSLITATAFAHDFDDLFFLEWAALADYKATVNHGPIHLPFKDPPLIDLSKPPEHYHDVMHRPDADIWIAAMGHEVVSLKENGVFQVANLTRCDVDHAVFIGVFTSPPDPTIPMPSDGSDLFIII
ncbi:hypothetical protein C0993_012384, partial [Termitomyces sp. T159_Od127]